MNSRVLKYLSILALALVLYNLSVFLLFTERANIFWITYGFTMFALLSQIIICIVASGKENTLKSKFLGFSILYLGSFYLFLQLVAGFIIMFFAADTINQNVAFLIYSIILGVSAILIMSVDLSRVEIKRVENKVSPKVFYIKSLQSDIEVLVDRCVNESIKKSLASLAESLRFSDPMSSEELFSIESKIENKVRELRSMDLEAEEIVKKEIDEVKLLVEERNNKCKLLK